MTAPATYPWKVGELAVCVDDSPGAISGRRLKRGRVYKVLAIWKRGTILGVLKGDLLPTSPAWFARRFRPLIDQADDAELIARIKQCKPALAPATADQLLARIERNRQHSVAAPTASDGSRPCVTHDAGPVPTARHSEKAGDDLINNNNELSSFHRGV